jgi:Flp pilus assembly protein TadG
MKISAPRRRGTVAILVAVTLVLLISFLAIALDGGLLLHNRRVAQAAADAAALAAADSLYLNYQANAGSDPGNQARNAALAVAAANGFGNDRSSTDVDVYIPPQSGFAANKAGYAEVVVTYNQPRGFSNILGTGPLPVTARAVATGRWSPFRDGILVLDPSASGSLSSSGTGGVNIVNADIIVDSNSPSAAISTGGATLTAQNFYITGVPGTSTSGGGAFNGTIWSGQRPTPDPLAYLPEPDPNTMILQSNNPTHASGPQTLNLQPGVYRGGITISGQASLNLAPGIYYMDGGGFSFTGLGNLTAPGVMIVNAPHSNSDRININGNGAINLSPPTSGIYTGISLWQIRSSTNEVDVSGNGGSQMTGTFYAQHGLLKVTGNGGNDVLGSQYISYDVNLGGNGVFTVVWSQQATARTRIINLVE